MFSDLGLVRCYFSLSPHLLPTSWVFVFISFFPPPRWVSTCCSHGHGFVGFICNLGCMYIANSKLQVNGRTNNGDDGGDGHER